MLSVFNNVKRFEPSFIKKVVLLSDGAIGVFIPFDPLAIIMSNFPSEFISETASASHSSETFEPSTDWDTIFSNPLFRNLWMQKKSALVEI